MNLKFLLPLTSLVAATQFIHEPMSFQFGFKIIANSYNPIDISSIYYYKEELIERYESLVFSFDERDYGQIIFSNICFFEIDDKCEAYYKDGLIYMIIGNGLGPTFNGSLRRNECDENVIREKFYIFELFQ